MPKYIDADALKEAFLFECKDVYDDTDEFDVKWGASQKLIEEVIDSAPAAHVAKVVYCSECVYHYDDGDHKCKKLRIPCPDDSEFFCKYGKKKRGE